MDRKLIDFRAPSSGSHVGPQSSIRGRARVLRLIICVVVGFYLCYLFDLQVMNGALYKRRAAAVASRIVPIPAVRGEIFDRNYDQPLALDVSSFAIDVVPAAASLR
ncbi:MAG TPA: hypothetical protein VMV68_04055, partial [Spirochaetia bacterium]|nr:hypothetical protein [Spirochaetia bacterium]